MKFFIKVITSILNGSFFQKVQRRIKRYKRERFKRNVQLRITNDKIRWAQTWDWSYRTLKKEFQYMLDEVAPAKPESQSKADKLPKIIWWCWLQGVESAPEMVQSCLESVKKNLPDYELRIITSENWMEYVELPDYILEKYRRGIMPVQKFTNLIRLNLLLRYGGLWIDATVLCTGREMCEVLEKSDLFMYAFICGHMDVMLAENWLIAAKPDNDILRLTWDLHMEYWKKHDDVINYRFFFLFLKMAAECYPDQWRKVHKFGREAALTMIEELDEPYSEERYAELKRISSFHKLNWKRKIAGATGSFYDVLIRQRRF